MLSMSPSDVGHKHSTRCVRVGVMGQNFIENAHYIRGIVAGQGPVDSFDSFDSCETYPPLGERTYIPIPGNIYVLPH